MSEFVTILKKENQAVNSEINSLSKNSFSQKWSKELFAVGDYDQKFAECFELSNNYDIEIIRKLENLGFENYGKLHIIIL